MFWNESMQMLVVCSPKQATILHMWTNFYLNYLSTYIWDSPSINFCLRREKSPFMCCTVLIFYALRQNLTCLTNPGEEAPPTAPHLVLWNVLVVIMPRLQRQRCWLPPDIFFSFFSSSPPGLGCPNMSLARPHGQVCSVAKQLSFYLLPQD